MKIYSFYSAKTGAFIPRKWSGPRAYLDQNTPPGFIPIEGRYDYRSQRFDLEAGVVVSDPDLASESNKRMQRERRRQAALIRIHRLEQRQARPMRELAINPQDAEARRRLDEIESEIHVARAALSETDTSERRE
jgi:hypothetical protein